MVAKQEMLNWTFPYTDQLQGKEHSTTELSLSGTTINPDLKQCESILNFKLKLKRELLEIDK